MKIHLCRRRHDAARKARAWFAAGNNYSTFEEVFQWSRLQKAWGDPHVFIEFDAAGSRQQNAKNVDFLIAFDDRVAVVEVKDHSSFGTAQASLFKSLGQCCENSDLISHHLAGAVQDQAVKPFLYIPRLTSIEIARLTDQQLAKTSLSHATIVGGFQCRSKPTLPNGHPLYLPTALKLRLGHAPDSPTPRYARNASAVLLNQLNPGELISYTDLSRTVEDLQTHSDVPTLMHVGEHHVPAHRRDELQQLKAKLAKPGAIEVSGPAGVGKSVLIREALAEVSAQHLALSIACVDLTLVSNLASICANSLMLVGQHPSGLETEEQLLQQLTAINCVLWIRQFEPVSRPLVIRLADRCSSTATTHGCRLIVETNARPILSEECRVSVPTLSYRDIARILRRIPSDKPSNTAAAVASGARGIPRLAISLWRQKVSIDARIDWLSADFAWLDHQFVSDSQRLLCDLVVSVLDSVSPIQISTITLRNIARAAFPGQLRSSIDKQCAATLAALDRAGLIDVRIISGSTYRVLEGQGYERMQWARAGYPDAGLSEFVRRRTDPKMLETWRALAAQIVASPKSETKHKAAVLGLLDRKIADWSSSPLRCGSMRLREVVHWLDLNASNRTEMPNVEMYLERALRLAYELTDEKKAREIFIERELDAPDGLSTECQYFYDLLRLVSYMAKSQTQELRDLCMTAAQDAIPELVCWQVSGGSRKLNRSVWKALRGHFEKSQYYEVHTQLLVMHSMLVCALFRGRRFLQRSAVKRALIDLSRRLGKEAADEVCTFYLDSAECFYTYLTTEAQPDEHAALSTIRNFAQSKFILG